MIKRAKKLAPVLVPAMFLSLLLLVPSLRETSRHASHEILSLEPKDEAPFSRIETEKGGSAERKTVRVMDEQGRPLSAGVRMVVSYDHFRTFHTIEATADKRGRLSFDVDPSAWVALSIQAPGHESRFIAPTTWKNLRERDLALALVSGRPVAGTLTSNTGRIMPNVRLQFSPRRSAGSYASIVASRMNIVDEEVTTDDEGRFHCSSLRPGVYRVSFPDHPKWPALTVKKDGELAIRVPWN